MQGHVKEILWHYNEKGEHEGELFATIEDYLPENAPERLLPHAAQPCDATACAALAGPAVSPLSALEAVLLAVLLGVLLAWLYSLLALRRRPRPPTPATVDDSDASAPLLLADFPRFAHAAGDGAHPVCSNSTSVTKVECFLRFAGLRYSKQAVSLGDGSCNHLLGAMLPAFKSCGCFIHASHAHQP